jgi:hypothetical protein
VNEFVRSRDGVIENVGKVDFVFGLCALGSSQLLAGQEFADR